MGQPQIIEGTWEEVSAQLVAHDEELRRYKRLRVVLIPEEYPTTFPPNEKGLAAMRQIAERQQNRPYSDDANSMKLLREARSGEMYGHEPGEH